MKKILALTLSLCLLLALLAACGTKTEPIVSASAPAASSEPTAAVSSTPAAPSEPAAVVSSAPAASSEPAAATDSAEVKLSFIFKNKTGSELVEAYVYPTGSDNKGANLLTAAWVNNTADADYLQEDITVPNADTYDIYVVSSDGKTCTFTGCDLKNNNSVSMKDMDGTISVKTS